MDILISSNLIFVFVTVFSSFVIIAYIPYLVNGFCKTFLAEIDLENKSSQNLSFSLKCSLFLTHDFLKFLCKLCKKSPENCRIAPKSRPEVPLGKLCESARGGAEIPVFLPY